MEQATHMQIRLGDTLITIEVVTQQLAVRHVGDLITAEIVSIDPAPYHES